jgi:hypothetical protein
VTPDPTLPATIEPTPGKAPARQLADLPRDELAALAEDFGLDPTRFKTGQLLVAAVHDRRQLIAGLDREALLDVVRWGRRPVSVTAGREQLAQQVARIRSMKFAGLSQRGLVALARLRGVTVADTDPVPVVVKKLRKHEGFFSRVSRRRRAAVGSLVARIVGDAGPSEYHFLPPTGGGEAAPMPAASIADEIEESGIVGGLTNRIKKSADSYLNQKLDEIESRIDRKLDEIDRRLAEWRDREIANRIRILKITLWASVIVGIVSLIYAYVKSYLPSLLGG